MIKGLVSVIIPTHKRKNGYNPMDNCLLAVANSTYKNIEIVGIDEDKERSEQRNIGIREAKGEFVCYLDDDQYVSPELIAECVKLMDFYDALYIPEIIITNNWFGKLRNWERQFYTGTVVDCIRFFKREGCPMFDTSMSGPEDADFDHRFVGSKGITENPLYHDDNISLISYLKKKAYYAESMAQFKKKWPDDKVLRPFYRCFLIFMENGKFIKFLARPHYAVGVLILIFIRGLVYLWQR